MSNLTHEEFAIFLSDLWNAFDGDFVLDVLGEWQARMNDKPVVDYLKIGDMIRILQGGFGGARVEEGDILTVTRVLEGKFLTEAPRLKYITGEWAFGYEDEGNGWEKVGE